MSFGPLAETHSPTGYEPTDLAEEDNSFLVKPMFFHRPPSMTSTCDSAESIATPPPESEMLASPLYLQEREASADRSRVYHSFRENSMSSSSHFRGQCTETCRSVLSHKKVESRDTFPTENAFPQDINQLKEKTKLYSGSLNRKKLRG